MTVKEKLNNLSKKYNFLLMEHDDDNNKEDEINDVLYEMCFYTHKLFLFGNYDIEGNK